jgi:hypothetical protein
MGEAAFSPTLIRCKKKTKCQSFRNKILKEEEKLPTLQPSISVPYLHWSIGVLKFAILYARDGALGSKTIFELRRLVMEYENIVAKSHLRKRNAKGLSEMVYVICVRDWIGLSRDVPSFNIYFTRIGRLFELMGRKSFSGSGGGHEGKVQTAA